MPLTVSHQTVQETYYQCHLLKCLITVSIFSHSVWVFIKSVILVRILLWVGLAGAKGISEWMSANLIALIVSLPAQTSSDASPDI